MIIKKFGAMATRGIKRRAHSIPPTYHSTNEEAENTNSIVRRLIIKNLVYQEVYFLGKGLNIYL
jgi:hypothetical protein